MTICKVCHREALSGLVCDTCFSTLLASRGQVERIAKSMGCDPARVEEAVDTFCEDAILSAKRCNELEEENTRLREERGDDDPDVYYRSCPRCKGSGQAYGVQGASLPGIECCVTPGYTTCPECSGTGRQRR